MLMYKGRPLRRIGNVVYYGRMADGYIVLLNILKSEQVNGLEVPTLVNVQLQNTAPGIPPSEVTIRNADKASFFDAIDIGEAWLKKALTDVA